MRMEVEVKSLPAQPPKGFLCGPGVQGLVARLFQERAVALQRPIDFVQYRMGRQGLAVVSESTGIVAEPLVGSACMQRCAAICASALGGEEKSHAAKKRLEVRSMSDLFVTEPLSFTNVGRAPRLNAATPPEQSRSVPLHSTAPRRRCPRCGTVLTGPDRIHR